MGRTPLFSRLIPTLRRTADRQTGITRRQAITAGLGSLAAARQSFAKPNTNIDVGIVGAGLAGLSCGWELAKRGVPVSLYEAQARTGGRCFSAGGAFPSPVNFGGQVVERGGEFLDTAHKLMIGYAREFGLTLKDVTRKFGETVYYFNGQRVAESAIVDEFRAFVPRMKADLRRISSAPTALNYTPDDQVFDYTSLREYLVSRGASALLLEVLESAYISDYGREIDDQSSLNFLLYMRADRRARFQPFGTSDQRYHIVEGNQGVAAGLTARLASRIEYGRMLSAVRKTSAGKIELTFEGGVTRTHDAVVITIPFTVLRLINLDPSLGLSNAKINAIQNLGYGNNAKLMIGFTRPVWREQASNGSIYADLPYIQNTWETNPTRATANRAVMTDYTGGVLGANMNPADPQGEAQKFLSNMNLVYPGSAAATTGAALLEHWPSNPLTRGSYTCYRPGQFTTIAGLESTSAGNLFFAGEHANSFYEFQGFMEGALRSGVDAASAVLS
jgi:monoamine oxidase